VLEVPPPASSFQFPCVVHCVVVVEFESSLSGNAPENPDVGVAHDHRTPGSRIDIEASTASGSGCGASCGLNRRYPTAPAGRARGCGGSPHAGQAVRYAAAAGVKRIRQRVQQAWLMAAPLDRELSRVFGCNRPSRLVLAGEPAAARWAGTVHHRIVQVRVAGLVVRSVAPAAEDPQDVSALAVMFTASFDDSRGRRPVGGRDQRSAGHWVTASLLKLRAGTDACGVHRVVRCWLRPGVRDAPAVAGEDRPAVAAAVVLNART
jgi:hypothetical protein